MKIYVVGEDAEIRCEWQALVVKVCRKEGRNENRLVFRPGHRKKKKQRSYTDKKNACVCAELSVAWDHLKIGE